MNTKRGLIRLGIVLAFGWTVFWGLMAYSGHAQVRYSIDEVNRIKADYARAGREPDDAYFTRIRPWMVSMNEAATGSGLQSNGASSCLWRSC